MSNSYKVVQGFSLRDGDTVTIEKGAVALLNAEVELSATTGVLYVRVPGLGLVSTLSALDGAGFVITRHTPKVIPLPTVPGWYESAEGKSMYLLTRSGVWFEIQRDGKTFEKTAAWNPSADIRPFKLVKAL